MILHYTGRNGRKTRSLKILGGEEEAAMYDLIFGNAPLRKVASKVGLSYQGVYIRALAYMKYWSRNGIVHIEPDYVEDLYEEYGEEANENIA